VDNTNNKENNTTTTIIIIEHLIGTMVSIYQPSFKGVRGQIEHGVCCE